MAGFSGRRKDMKKVSAFILILSGAIFSVFVFNIVLYAVVPEYRSAINVFVDKSDDKGDDRISVVTSNAEESDESVVITLDEDNKIPMAENAEETDAKAKAEKAIEALEDQNKDNSDKPQIVSKEYHEDCGTKKGYWVITYADGSIGIE